MHFPVDPNKREGLWAKLKTSLTTEKNCFMISKGVANENIKAKVLSTKEAEDLLIRLKDADYVRIGASRGQPLPAHFAINFKTAEEVFVSEYIALANQTDGTITLEKVKKDLYLMAETAFYDCPNVKFLRFPIKLNPEKNNNYELKRDEKTTVISKVSDSGLVASA